MAKGTASMGKHSRGLTHIRCRRCGRKTYHASKKVCAACGFGKASKQRKYKWQTIAH